VQPPQPPNSKPTFTTVTGRDVSVKPFDGCSYVYTCAASFADRSEPHAFCQGCVPTSERDCPWH
jgi:hypothetical protein